MAFGNHFLESLPPKINGHLMPFLRKVSLNKDDFLCQQGEPAKWVYFPVTAVISQYQMLEDGRTIEVAIVGREGAAGLSSVKEAGSRNLTITPRDRDSARRSYGETVDLWASRVDPALQHWIIRGRLSQEEAIRIKSLTPFQQVSEIFKLEAKGIYFAKDLSKSIIYSVAPPGTSQHLAMLAFDVQEHGSENVREILARHGWFQTVISDLPHFTFLGVPERKLAGLGLKMINDGGRRFWVPDL